MCILIEQYPTKIAICVTPYLQILDPPLCTVENLISLLTGRIEMQDSRLATLYKNDTVLDYSEQKNKTNQSSESTNPREDVCPPNTLEESS